MATILLTGVAGFIGSNTCRALLDRGDRVIGVDNFNDYYDVKLKRDRIGALTNGAEIIELDIANTDSINRLFKEHRFDQVCHLAAQAGVQYSLINPYSYEYANNLGTLNIFEACRQNGVRSVVYASSSSVYGNNKKIPFSVDDDVSQPISLYAATKRANELAAHTYHHLFGMNLTGLRFFTVYGPWGRPDMALFKFTKAILAGESIKVFNFGKMKRDFTFISDIVAGILASLDKNYPYEIFNLGNSDTVDLLSFVETIEKALGKTAKKELLPMLPGDVPETYADIKKSTEKLGFKPKVKIDEGIGRFIEWYRTYNKIVA